MSLLITRFCFDTVKGAICKNQKLLVHSDTCGRNVNESQRPVSRARACARATLT